MLLFLLPIWCQPLLKRLGNLLLLLTAVSLGTVG